MKTDACKGENIILKTSYVAAAASLALLPPSQSGIAFLHCRPMGEGLIALFIPRIISGKYKFGNSVYLKVYIFGNCRNCACALY